jgi:hypothetical protein
MSNCGSISWERVWGTAIPLFLILFVLLWHFDGRSIPGNRVRLFDSPISGINHIQIRSGGNLSLLDRDLTITDTSKIKEIMTAIRLARPYSANHPADHWTCVLIISNESGHSRVDVSDTLGDGTLIWCVGEELRSDTLGAILEKVTAEK